MPNLSDPQLQERLALLIEETGKNRFHELEVKFGFLSDSKFKSGIAGEQFERLFAWLSTARCWREVKHNEYVDYSFKNSIRGSGALFDERIHFLTKRTHRHLDVRCVEGTGALAQPGQVCLRFSLKSEIPTELGIGRDIGTYNSVRVKQRSSFIYKGWSFDLTKVWTGPDPVSALSIRQQTDLLNLKLPLERDRPPDSYEVELELLQGWWAENTPTSSYLAESMLAKIVDILASSSLIAEPYQFVLYRELNFQMEEENSK